MNRESAAPRKFRIVSNEGDERHPFALVSPDGLVIRVHDRPGFLSDFAFNVENADEVTHDGEVCLKQHRRIRE